MAATVANACIRNITDTGYLCDILDRMDAWLSWHDVVGYFSYNPWIFSLLGSTMVGLTGIFPLWLIPIQDGVDLKTGENGGTLKILLSFAVGALLGDVFLHLLPEAYESELQRKGNILILCYAIYSYSEIKALSENFLILMHHKLPIQCFLEKQSGKNGFIPNGIKEPRKNGFKEVEIIKSALASECPNDGPLVDEAKSCLKKLAKTNGFTSAISRAADPSCIIPPNTIINRLAAWTKKFTFNLFRKCFNPKAFPGYLNLLMNFLDNFTHGLSVGGSFLISFRVGLLSTFTILVHEIPHEVGDFAILLRSGFSRWDAARAQLITASGGIVGALAAVSFSGSLGK
ncbi:hypothetical protein DMN91_010235 [Ooceraea biroi]|uniref:Zinc transporter ZIP13-like protein n=1 Tax=Ooceraea biroi TaxID=2015173 RepID=A0A3L8DCB4_OOCBI|nr:hypothetical protein DMN91_010235 [Ooceraea biroi]